MTKLELNQEVFVSYLVTLPTSQMLKSVRGKVTKVTPIWYAVSYGRHTQWVKRDSIEFVSAG